MIEDYINRLQEQNKEKLNSYDEEMQELTADLSAAEKHLSQLEKEKSDDKNIFSPRTLDSGRDQEIQKVLDQVQSLKQHLDYVGRMVESEMKNKEIYLELAEVAAKETAEKADVSGTCEQPSGNTSSAGPQDLPNGAQTVVSDSHDFVAFLDSIYNKVEFSYSLISGNKNRCRSELKTIERMIRSYEEGLQKNENS